MSFAPAIDSPLQSVPRPEVPPSPRTVPFAYRRRLTGYAWEHAVKQTVSDAIAPRDVGPDGGPLRGLARLQASAAQLRRR